MDKYKELEKEIEELKNTLAIQRTVEYVIYSVVDYEGGTLTYDELGGTTKYGIASRFHPDINVIWMLKEFNVGSKTTMVSPLSGFYATPGAGMSEIRIAYVLEADKLADAVKILGEGIKVYNSKK